MSQNTPMTVADLEGTLLSVKEQGISTEFIIWFPFSKNAMKTLREGVLLVAKNYSSTQNEDRLSVMQITKAVPSHYALGMAGSEKIDAYPGFVDAAYESVFTDLNEDSGDESTKILVHAAPVYLEIPQTNALVPSTTNVEPKPVDETSIPMLGSKVNVLTPQWTEKVFNKDIGPNVPQIEIGKLANMTNVDISLLWEEMIRTHFGIFAYTNAGKSNLTSTFISKIFQQTGTTRPNVGVYDLQNEYGGLLIDVLQTTVDSAIVYVDEETVDQAVMDYWMNPTAENRDRAAELLARTTILPKQLLEYRSLFVDPYKLLLHQGKIKLFSLDTTGTLRSKLTELLNIERETITGQLNRRFVDFMTNLITNHGNEEQTVDLLNTVLELIETEITEITNLRIAHAQIKTSMQNIQETITQIRNQLQNGTIISDEFLISDQQIIDSFNDPQVPSLYVFQGEERSVRLLSDSIGQRMMESRRRSGNIEPVVSFIYDEADQFIPQDTARIPGSVESKERAVQIARRGRKYGIGIGIGTQRIVYLDTNVLGQPHTYFVSKLPRATDREKIQEAFGLSDNTLNQTHRFKKGQWLLVSHSATGLDGEPIVVTLPNANDRLETFLQNFTLPNLLPRATT